MAQLKSTTVQGNLTASGSLIASKISIFSGGSNQILMANGSTQDFSTLINTTQFNALQTTVANVSSVANAADTLSKANAAALPGKANLAADNSFTASNTFTQPVLSTYVSSSYVGSCAGRSAFNVGSGSYTGWISGYTKNGRMAIATYENNDDQLKFVYITKTKANAGTNEPDSIMTWNGPTNTLTATTFVGSLNGNATSASQFSSAQSVTLTGDVTGTASSVAGWSITTSLPARLKNYQNSSYAVSDANNATETGFYYMAATSAGGGNRPPFASTTNDYRILTTAYSADWLQQIATNYRSNEIFFRRRDNDQSTPWTPWVQIQTTESADAIYVNVSGDTMTGTLHWTQGTLPTPCLNLRNGHASYDGVISYQTAGNEAMLFTTKNAVTSFMFVNGEDTIANAAITNPTAQQGQNKWNNITTPGLQVKNNCVSMGVLIGNGVTPTERLWIKGDVKIDNDTRDADSTKHKKGNLTLAGHVIGSAHSSSWWNGRDNALVRMITSNGYAPILSMKTTSGSWEMGHYNSDNWHETFLLNYQSDTKYNKKGTDNTVTHALKLSKEGNLTLSGNTIQFSSANFIYNSGDRCIDVTFN